MRSVTERRFPTVWIILFALIGIAASVALGIRVGGSGPAVLSGGGVEGRAILMSAR